MGNKLHSLRTWLTEPASWLSLSAIVISALTFFLTYAYKGELTLILPDRIGVVGKPGLAVAMPLVFTNSGAARTHRHVVETTADLTFKPLSESQPRTLPLLWEYELEFISTLEFRHRYPEAVVEGKKTSDDQKTPEGQKTPEDQIVYTNRAFPFHLAGGTSVVKVYRFTPRDNSVSVREIGPLDVTVKVRTVNENLSFTAKYRCPAEALNDAYWWCWRE
jgi:hypothetical protein